MLGVLSNAARVFILWPRQIQQVQRLSATTSPMPAGARFCRTHGNRQGEPSCLYCTQERVRFGGSKVRVPYE